MKPINQVLIEGEIIYSFPGVYSLKSGDMKLCVYAGSQSMDEQMANIIQYTKARIVGHLTQVGKLVCITADAIEVKPHEVLTGQK